ncbi:hypothetical protein FBU30_005134 [Linnemannia zychae]|nr:hypothetical protein FBU30_005134 [Linnemannia zychae]
MNYSNSPEVSSNETEVVDRTLRYSSPWSQSQNSNGDSDLKADSDSDSTTSGSQRIDNPIYVRSPKKKNPKQRDRVLTVFLQQEALMFPSSTGKQTLQSSAASTSALKEQASSLSYYRKLTFTTTMHNQLRILLAAEFLNNQLKKRARLSDPSYMFKIPCWTDSPIYSELADELKQAYYNVPRHNPSLPSIAETNSLFNGISGSSLGGLCNVLLLKAQELENFQASEAALHDPWTPTRLSTLALELLAIDRAVRTRSQMQKSVGEKTETEKDIDARKLRDSKLKSKRIGSIKYNNADIKRAEIWEEKLKALLDEEFRNDLAEEEAAEAANNDEKIKKGDKVTSKVYVISDKDEYPGTSDVAIEMQSVPASIQEAHKSRSSLSSLSKAPVEMSHAQNSGSGICCDPVLVEEHHHPSIIQRNIDRDEHLFFDSGISDGLWEVVVIQTQTFQELKDEIVSLREEVARLQNMATKVDARFAHPSRLE